MNHPEKMPDQRFTTQPISEVEIAKQHMELQDQEDLAQRMAQRALGVSAAEEQVLLDILGKIDNRRDKQD